MVLLGLLLLAFPGPGAPDPGDARPGCRPSAFSEARKGMVRTQIQSRGVRDSAVLEAMRTVPRHCFIPPVLHDRAYGDYPLPIGQGQTISQPYIVALMTELLSPKPSHRILEIGTGSGYQAAVLSGIVKQVYSVEIFPSLARKAAAKLQALGLDNVSIKHGDGNFGWEEHAPFDGILVTAAAAAVPPALIRQLKPGGRLIIPVGGVHEVQRLTVVTKDSSGKVDTREVLPVRFVPLLEGR